MNNLSRFIQPSLKFLMLERILLIYIIVYLNSLRVILFYFYKCIIEFLYFITGIKNAFYPRDITIVIIWWEIGYIFY